MSNWQPIETMPKDGEYIIRYSKHDICIRVCSCDGDLAFPFISIDGKNEWSQPDGWMPLPEPPTTTHNSGG